MTITLSKKQWDSVESLVNTSVEDARSSLGCNRYSPDVLRKAIEITHRRGEKTKEKMFAIALRKREKAIKAKEI